MCIRDRETAGKEAEESESAAETAGADSTQFQSSILFCGSTSLYPILSSLASSFTEKYVTWDAVDSSFPDSNISVYVAPGGSGVGVSAAIDGTADFGMLARDIKDSEICLLYTSGLVVMETGHRMFSACGMLYQAGLHGGAI